jgi:hypothetical protein
VAIVQISQITNRKGLQVDLPQLAGAELGWSIDTRRLFIGNGTLQEGAPVVGNTEILTEFSDILAFQTTYTYKGEAAGYTVQTGPTGGDPVTQSLQSWLDQFATVKDFGAVGDGVADDTDAINRALYQLFCRETNPQIRRSLFFPAGVYRITQSIFIPTYATLWGEGPQSSVIQMDNGDDSTLTFFVARTADSLQQYGANIGANGATPPQDITITNMGFRNLDPTTDVFMVEDASNCSFQNVSFAGPLLQADLNTDVDDTACVRFASTPALITSQIVFDGCQFTGCTYGLNTATGLAGTDQQVAGVTVSNSNLNTLYQGIVTGTETLVGTGATGWRIMGNLFDLIYAQGVYIGDVSLNATGHNIFYNVGNHFGAATTPWTSIIQIESSNNVSISDLFERADAFSTTETPGVSFPRIVITNNATSIATTNGYELALGSYTRRSGIQTTLLGGQTGVTIFTLDAATYPTFAMYYTIVRGTDKRTGVFTVVNEAVTGNTGNDEYTENSSTGITLAFTTATGTCTLSYTSSAGASATFNYSIVSLG